MTIRRPGLWVLGLVLLMALAIGITIGSIHSQASSGLAGHDAQINGEMQALRGRAHERPVILGLPVDGNAWDFYGPPLVELRALEDDEGRKQVGRILGHPFSKNVDPDPQALDRMYARYRRILGALREGASRTRVDPVFAPGMDAREKYEDLMMSSTVSLREMTALVLADAQAGNQASALETAALLFVVAQDLPRGGALAGASGGIRVENQLLEALPSLFSSWDVPAAELRRFADRLDSLDRFRSSCRETWENESLRDRYVVFNEEELYDYVGNVPLKAGWRCLFSSSVMRVQALNQCRSAFEQLVAAADRGPGELEAISDAIELRLRNHPNPVINSYFLFDSDRQVIWSVPDHVRERTGALTNRALLRVATALACYEAEKGKTCERLEQLVPAYLARLPLSPLNGAPLVYASGRLSWPGRGNESDNEVVWTVKRKKP